MNSDNHYFSRLLRKNIWIYFFSFLIAPTGYIVKIVISNSVSVEELWTLYAVMSFMVILWAYNDFWMTESLNYFLPWHIHEKNKKKITSTFSIAFCTQMLTSTVLAVLIFFWSQWLARNYFDAPQAAIILNILVIQFFSENIFRTVNTFFQAVQDTFLQNRLTFSACLYSWSWFVDYGILICIR